MYGFLLDGHLGICNGVSYSKPAFTAVVRHSILQKKGTGVQQVWISGIDKYPCCSPEEKTQFMVLETPRDLRSWGPIIGVGHGWVNCSKLATACFGRQVFRSNMSATDASRFSNLEISDNSDEQQQKREGRPLSVDIVHRHHASNGFNGEVDLTGGVDQRPPLRRHFCKRCGKAGTLCICHYIKTVVNNKTAISILQHPREKQHPLGSARIALLALQNVEIISIPEMDDQNHRIREKVPGSKRFIAGRGGKKAQKLKEGSRTKKTSSKWLCAPTLRSSHSEQELNLARGEGTPLTFNVTPRRTEDAVGPSDKDPQFVQQSTVPHWIKLQPDAGLLFPSVHAVDLWPVGLELISSSDFVLTFQSELGNGAVDESGKRVSRKAPSQLIVLDGTWSKAKRIFYENPWLLSLPHYRLPTLQHSRYGYLRREPKPGCLSTVESIVYALQLLEPETKDLDSLLDVFDSMIEDQMKYAAKSSVKTAVKEYST